MNIKFQNYPRCTALLLSVVISLFFLSGCSTILEKEESSAYKLTIENQSDTEVYEISYSSGNNGISSGGGIHADGSPIGKGEDFSFIFEEKPGALNLSFLDEEKKVLAVSSIAPSFEDTRVSTYILTSVQGNLTLEEKN